MKTNSTQHKKIKKSYIIITVKYNARPFIITIEMHSVHICRIKHAPNDSDITRICAAKYTEKINDTKSASQWPT